MRPGGAGSGPLLAAPATLYAGVLLLAPLAVLVAYSFWTQNYLDIDRTLTLANYRKAFGDPLARQLLFRSVRIAGLVTIVTVCLAYPIAYFISFRTTKKTQWLLFITIPFWISYLLRVFSWQLILGFNGLLNSTLLASGLINEPLDFLLYNEFAVVLTLAHAWAPFAILPIFVALERLDRSLLEAATDLGCSSIARFFRITLPLTLPGVIASCLIIFIPTVGDYVTPALVGGSDGKMIANLVQVYFQAANNWPLGATLSIMTMICVSLIATIFAVVARSAGKVIR